MLEDRDYMRQSYGRLRWTATLTLIVILTIIYLLQLTVLPGRLQEDYLALSLGGIKQGYMWQLLTFQFLHGGWIHLLGNCFTLYVFGREVESRLGKVWFLILYFLSGVVGGLFQVFASFVWPNYFGGWVVGASAGIFGVAAAFAMLFSDEVLTMLIFPVSMRAKTLLYVFLGISALGIAFPNTFGNHIAHAAHLGGILTGMAFIRYGGEFSRNLLGPFESRRRKRELIKAVSIKIPQWPRQKSDSKDDVPEEEFISREVDPILDKISQHGIQSLTERERKILEAARNRMAKR